MSDKPVERAPNSSFVEDFRKFIGIIGSIGGFCYVIGFMIVNIYLGQYGVHDLALIKPQYFAAGLLYLVLSALIGVSPLVSVSLLRDLRDKGLPIKTRHIVIFIGANLLVLATVIWLTGIFLTGAEPAQFSVVPVQARQAFIWLFLPASQLTLWIPLVLGWGVWSIFQKRAARIANPDHSLTRLRTLMLSAFAVLGVVCIVISFFIFAVWVFPHVSAILGGAAPVNVRLLLSDEGVAVFHSLPVKIQDRSTEPLILIDQTGDHVLLLYGSSPVIELSSRAITGIIYNSP